MRVAVLGIGDMGRMHAAYYRTIPGADLVAVSGRTRARVLAAAKELHTAGTTDYREILEDESVDAVDICLPTAVHREAAIAALEAGKHVFVETPLATTSRDAGAMISAARRRRRILMVADVMRSVSGYVYIQRAVASRRMGRPLAGFASRMCAPYWERRRPRTFDAFGDPLVELAVHDLDYLNWVLGMPEEVSATGTVEADGAVTQAFISLWGRGVQALVEMNARMPWRYPFSTVVRIVSERGVLENVQRFGRGAAPEVSLMRHRAGGRVEPVRIQGWDPYEVECRHFVDAVRGKARPEPLRAENDLQALRIAEAARESIRRKRAVPLRGDHD